LRKTTFYNHLKAYSKEGDINFFLAVRYYLGNPSGLNQSLTNWVRGWK